MSGVRVHTTVEEPSIAISAVVPTRLGAGWLPRCLDSLIDQDITIGYEIIVVQFGPDDGTRVAVEEAGRRRPDVRLRHLSSAAPTRAAAKNLGGARVSDGTWCSSMTRIASLEGFCRPW